MSDKQMLDIYSDYLLALFSYTTATGLSRLTEGEISHDQVTRFLSNGKTSPVKANFAGGFS